MSPVARVRVVQLRSLRDGCSGFKHRLAFPPSSWLPALSECHLRISNELRRRRNVCFRVLIVPYLG
jgi:hypothetical protein